MLLINGAINSRFVKNLRSPYTRNAVCTTKNGELYFIITSGHDADSEYPSFYTFAAALKNFGCYQALYLDGNISHAYIPSLTTRFHWKPFVGIIAVTANE